MPPTLPQGTAVTVKYLNTESLPSSLLMLNGLQGYVLTCLGTGMDRPLYRVRLHDGQEVSLFVDELVVSL